MKGRSLLIAGGEKMNVYLTEHGACIRKNGGKIEITKDDQIIAQYPMEKLETITLFTSSQITSQCLEELSERNINVSWLSNSGKFVGCLMNPKKVDILKQKEQFKILEEPVFCLELSKRIILAKITNQRIFLGRQNKEPNLEEVKTIIEEIKSFGRKIENIDSLEELGGIEGYSARKYFEGLKYFIPQQFNFSKRTKNPPLDPASSLFSFAYTLLFNDVFLAVHNVGFNPYVGAMHKIRQGHPALVSDLMEEWRPVIADAIVVDLLKNGQISPADFEEADNGGVYLNKAGAKKLITGYEKKMHSKFAYLKKNGVSNDLRSCLTVQIYEFLQALQNRDADAYKAVMIR